MPNHKDEFVFVSDQASIAKPFAQNVDERREALDFCLAQRWANADVGRVERIDTAAESGWRMWRYKSDPS